MARAVQIFLVAISMYHEDHAINRCRGRALGAVEGEIPSSAAVMAVFDAKVATPEHAQACLVFRFVEKTFLQKVIK